MTWLVWLDLQHDPELEVGWLLAGELQDLVLDKEASQTSQVERENLMSLFLPNFAAAALGSQSGEINLLFCFISILRSQTASITSNFSPSIPTF